LILLRNLSVPQTMMPPVRQSPVTSKAKVLLSSSPTLQRTTAHWISQQDSSWSRNLPPAAIGNVVDIPSNVEMVASGSSELVDVHLDTADPPLSYDFK
jgi:hypothetical protein